MNWRDELREASFRGVPFAVRRHSITGGRRTQQHEFPLRDKPATQDVGRKGHSFTIRAIVVGENYMDQRDRLLDALDACGDGVLVHPYYGSKTVAVQNWRVEETTKRGGMATFFIRFCEGGELVEPDEAQDTGWFVAKAAEKLTDAAEKDFADRADASGPEGVRDSFLDKVDDALDEVTKAVEEVGAFINQATAPLTRIIAMKTKVEALLAYPITLAGQISTLLDGLLSFDLPNYRLLLSLFTSKSAFSSGGHSSSSKPVLSTVGKQIETNDKALTGLFRGALLAAAVKASATQTFATYDDSLTVRDILLDALDEEAATADNNVYQALVALRTAVVRDFASRESLPRLTSYTPTETLPALVVSHAIYGDAIRADDIVSRNGIRHPGAVPGGRTLKVLTDE